MAALQKIRNKSGLLIAALGFALLAFILGDLFNSGGTLLNRFKDKAFAVDGDVVSTGNYQDRSAQFEEYQKMISGRSSFDEGVSSQIKEYVYQMMVKESILDKQAEELGLTVTRAEMNDMVSGQDISPVILQSPLFADQSTQQFNPANLAQFLTFIKKDVNTLPDNQKNTWYTYTQLWAVIENMMKYNRLEQKYNSLLASTILTNDSEAKSAFESSKLTSDIVYSVSRYSAIADSTIVVSDAEIKKLYDLRKNNFKTYQDSRTITYLVKDILPSDEDYLVIEKEIAVVAEKMKTTDNAALLVADYSEVPFRNAFIPVSQLNQDEKTFVEASSNGAVYGPIKDRDAFRLYKLIEKTVAPESVELSVIVVPPGADAAASSNRADSIMTVLKAGKEFATVANEINPQAKGGYAGWVTEKMIASMGEDYIQSCFRGTKGELLKLNVGELIQIIKVQDLKEPIAKAKLALVQMTVPVSDKTLHAIDSKLNKYIEENGTADKFQKASYESGYNVISETPISPSEIGLPQVAASRQIIHWAFNEKVGSIKKFDLAEQRVVVLINSEQEAGYSPLSVEKKWLEAEIRKDKKAEKIIADLKAKNINTLEAYANVMGSKIDTARFVNLATPNVSGVGREPILNVYSKYGEPNKLVGPLKGNTGVYVLNVLSKVENTTPFDAVATKASLSQMNMRRINPTTLMDVLKVKLDVEDNRVKFF